MPVCYQINLRNNHTNMVIPLPIVDTVRRKIWFRLSVLCYHPIPGSATHTCESNTPYDYRSIARYHTILGNSSLVFIKLLEVIVEAYNLCTCARCSASVSGRNTRTATVSAVSNPRKKWKQVPFSVRRSCSTLILAQGLSPHRTYCYGDWTYFAVHMPFVRPGANDEARLGKVCQRPAMICTPLYSKYFWLSCPSYAGKKKCKYHIS